MQIFKTELDVRRIQKNAVVNNLYKIYTKVFFQHFVEIPDFRTLHDGYVCMICSIHINKRAFRNQDQNMCFLHIKIKMCFLHIISNLEWDLRRRKKL